MARRPPSEPPAEQQWTPESIRTAAKKLQRRVDDLGTFEPEKVTRRDDPKIDALEASIAETLSDVFGPNSGSFRRYQNARQLDTAGLNMNGTPHHEVIEGLVHGKERAIELLRGAIRSLKEKMEDDFPGEPFDQVTLSARSTMMSTGRADPRISRAGVAQAGAAIVGFGGDGISRPNDVPATGVIMADTHGEAPDIAAFTGTVGNNETHYGELQTRLSLLESSLRVLRQEITSQRAGLKIGPGHNQGPDFLPVPVEELDEIDHLIALLKDNGPTPPSDPTPLIEQNAKVGALGDRINAALLTLGTEMTKGAAREGGKELLATHWASLTHWIVSVGHGLLVWLGMN